MMRRLQIAALCAASPCCLFSQQPTAYKQPPAPIAAMLDAEPLPSAVISPQRDRILLVRSSALPSIEETSAPLVRLAGTRVNPRTNGNYNEPTVSALTIRNANGAMDVQVSPPARGKIVAALWAPDGAHLAFYVRGDSGITIWAADANTGRSRQLTRWTLSMPGGPACSWATISSLLCRMVVPNRGTAPGRSETPGGPAIQETEGAAAPNATVQDLLQSPTDEALFDYYFTSQIAAIGLDGSVRAIGKPGIYVTSRASPDSRWILIQSLHRPYSYQVPRFYFPTRTEIWSADGKSVQTVADV